MKFNFIWGFLFIFNYIENVLRKVFYYEFLSKLITSFVLWWAIPTSIFIVSDKDLFNWISNYWMILLLVWISVAYYLIVLWYWTLNKFLEDFKKSKLPYKVDDIKQSFYNNKKEFVFFIMTLLLISPIIYNIIYFFTWYNFLFLFVSWLYVILFWHIWLYFIFNSVEIISKIILNIDMKEIELFHYDKMWWIKFLSNFSNITTLLWFSSSICIPVTIEVLNLSFNVLIFQYSMFLLIILIWLRAFLFPQILIRKKSIEIKSFLLNEANSIIENEYFKDKRKILEISEGDREKIKFYNEYYLKKIEELKVWPFNVSGFFSFLWSIMIPVIVSFITYLLNIN